MSAPALHLNLLNSHEQRSSSPVRTKVIVPVAAGIVLTFIVLWCGFLFFEYLRINAERKELATEISKLSAENAACEVLMAKYNSLRSETEQYDYYLNGRRNRGDLLRFLALAVPEDVTLTRLSIPEPPPQELRRPAGSSLPPLQGPTETTEKVELRLTGLAKSEQAVFRLMAALKSDAFTNELSVVEHPANGERESPRVLSFRQDTLALPGATGRGVFFDIVYDLKPREFVK